MHLEIIEDLYNELSLDGKNSIAVKKLTAGNHSFLLATENKTPIFAIECTQAESSAIAKLGLESLNIFRRKFSVESDPEKEYLVVSLKKFDDAPVFYRVIESLIYDFERKTGDTYILCLLNLKKWKSFWGNKKDKGLSPEELIGLYGELTLIKRIYDINQTLKIDCWTGPFGSEHDFVFPDMNIEVKTTKSVLGSISISSIRQLEIVDNKKLYLQIWTLEETANESISLKELVYSIDEKADSEEQDLYWRRLSKIGYRLEDEGLYDLLRFRIKESKTYEIKEQFPRITNKSFLQPLDPRIRSLVYNLELKNLDDYIIKDFDLALKKLN